MNQSSRSQERGRTRWDFANLILGFAGGALASLTIFVVKHVPGEFQDHALLSGPFLAFLAAIILLAIFHRPLREALTRGNLTFSWGDKTISIQDFEEHFDQELEARLDTLASEVEDLREQISEKPGTGQGNLRPGTIDNIKKAFDIQSDDLASIIAHLGASKYKWRNQRTLTKRISLSASEIDDLVRQVPNLVFQGRGKSGNTIYRLTDSAMREFMTAFLPSA